MQFGLSNLLGLSALICVLLAWQQMWGISLAVASLGVILLFSELLTRNLPKAIQRQVDENCIRLDGSTAKGRVEIETLARNKLRRNVYWLLLIVLAPNLILLWVIDREVVPLSVGVDAVSSFNPSGAEWKKNLKDEEIRFDKWAKDKTISTNPDRHKRWLWRGSPVLILCGAVWVVACFAMVQSGYLRLLRDFLNSSRLRGESYKLRDLGRLE